VERQRDMREQLDRIQERGRGEEQEEGKEHNVE
jgi:hypothetical protein